VRPGQPIPDFPKRRFDSVELPEECDDYPNTGVPHSVQVKLNRGLRRTKIESTFIHARLR
jgi:hypothetical protein